MANKSLGGGARRLTASAADGRGWQRQGELSRVRTIRRNGCRLLLTIYPGTGCTYLFTYLSLPQITGNPSGSGNSYTLPTRRRSSTVHHAPDCRAADFPFRKGEFTRLAVVEQCGWFNEIETMTLRAERLHIPMKLTELEYLSQIEVTSLRCVLILRVCTFQSWYSKDIREFRTNREIMESVLLFIYRPL